MKTKRHIAEACEKSFVTYVPEMSKTSIPLQQKSQHFGPNSSGTAQRFCPCRLARKDTKSYKILYVCTPGSLHFELYQHTQASQRLSRRLLNYMKFAHIFSTILCAALSYHALLYLYFLVASSIARSWSGKHSMIPNHNPVVKCSRKRWTEHRGRHWQKWSSNGCCNGAKHFPQRMERE